MKTFLLVIIGLIVGIQLFAQPMVLKFNNDLNAYPVYLPLRGTVDVVVDWGDGAIDTIRKSGDYSHAINKTGMVEVSISGTLTEFGKGFFSYLDMTKLVEVLSFGEIGLVELNAPFVDADNLEKVPTTLPTSLTRLYGVFSEIDRTEIENLDKWDVGNITDMTYLFYQCSVFNQDLSSWNTENVTCMYGMFKQAKNFNVNIGNWNVGNVTNMAMMFEEAGSFNQDITSWNVSNVETFESMFRDDAAFNQNISGWDVSSAEDISYMFDGASKFNQDISSWDVSKVTNMWSVFSSARAFNQDISGWDVSNVTAFSSMFNYATSFNQDISGWDVSSASKMRRMFKGASAFNQNLGNWNIENVRDFTDMFDGKMLSTQNYDSLLIGWAAQNVRANMNFNGGYSKYSMAADSARNKLIEQYGWTITDRGVDVTSVHPQDVRTEVAIYPTICKDQFYLKEYNRVSVLRIYDLKGHIVMQKNNFDSGDVNVSHLSEGIYIVEFKLDDGLKLSTKIIKN